MEPDTDWLSEILQHVQLEQFYVPIRDQLQVNKTMVDLKLVRIRSCNKILSYEFLVLDYTTSAF